MARESFYSQEAANKRQSFLLAAFVILVFAALGFSIGYAITGSAAGAASVTAFALVLGALTGVGSYFSGDKLVLAVSQARPVDATNSASAHERRPGAGARGEFADARRVHHRRHGAERVRDRPGPRARVSRDHDRPAREARPRGAPGCHRPRAVARPQLRHQVLPDRRRDGRDHRAACRLLPSVHVLGRHVRPPLRTGTAAAMASRR